MMSPTDAVRYGMGFDKAGHWHGARPHFIPARRKFGEEDPIAPARGALFGLLVSGVMWAGLFFASHALLGLF